MGGRFGRWWVCGRARGGWGKGVGEAGCEVRGSQQLGWMVRK